MTIDSCWFETKEAWRAWLDANHASVAGMWLRIAKKGGKEQSVSYGDALEIALCYGWIDGQKKTGPEGFWLQRFTPRGERSIWSQVNRAKALALIEEGLMRPAGLVAVAQAKKNGQWDAAYEAVSAAKVPDDLKDELRKNVRARAFFDKLNSQNRYAILFRLQTASKPETRARRLKKFVQMLSEGETIHPQRTIPPKFRGGSNHDT